MVALSSLAGAGWQFFGNNGLPLAGGKLFTYAAGTTTPLATYTSNSGATPHANPIVLDSAGRVPSEIWLTSSALYKFTLKTSTNVEIWTKDNVPGIVSASDLGLYVTKAELASNTSGQGAGLMGTTLGITEEDVNDGLVMQAPWIGAAGDGSDCTSVVNTYLASNTRLHFPARVGTRSTSRYGISSPILITQNGTHISFDKGARLVGHSGVNPGGGIRINGTAPTSYINLSANAAEGQNQIVVAADPGWVVGDWLELRSEGLITGCPNSQTNKIGCLRKITEKNGTGPFTFSLNKELPYTFLTTDTAKAGKAGVIENVLIDCAQINDENFGSNIISFPIYLNYAAYVTLLNCRAYGSKLPYGLDNPTGDFIKMNRAFDVEIRNPFMRHGAYYGLSIPGMIEDVRSYGGSMEDVRHAVSVVYLDAANPDKYGQPINVLIDGMTASYCSLSSFDTHDTGRDIRFTNCVSDSAGDDGFQARTTNVTFNQCEARYSFFDGFSQSAGASGLQAVNCVSEYNGRIGVNWNQAPTVWIGGRVNNNGSSLARGGTKGGGGPAFTVYGGTIANAQIYENGGIASIIHGQAIIGQGPLLVTSCTIPASPNQAPPSLIAIPAGMDFSVTTLRDNEIAGYGNNLFQNFGTTTNISPVTSKNQITGTGNLRSGRAVLVAGSVTVANTAIRNKAAAAFAEAILCAVDLRRAVVGGTAGALYIDNIVDQTSFTIKSTSALDTSTVVWDMSL
jgi:hypothetical protein